MQVGYMFRQFMVLLLPHLRYLWYVVRHKWFVLIECCRLGIPWRGIMHDVSKFLPSEWFPYVVAFYGSERVCRDSTGGYDPSKVGGSFDYAWLHHQHHNPHHWQYWVLLGDEDAPKILPIPDNYRREMLADWYGAGRAQGTPDVRAWYEAHANKMLLHPETRKSIEEQLYGEQSDVQ